MQKNNISNEIHQCKKTYKDLTYKKSDEVKAVREKEGYFDEVAYSVGVYGCNGLLLKGHNTGKMYTITARTQAIYLI